MTNLPSDTSRVSRLENLTWWKRTLITSLLVLVLSLVLIILTETFVRVRHYVVFGDFKRVEDTFEVDPSLDLRVPKPGWNDGRIRINALGFRSPEIDARREEMREETRRGKRREESHLAQTATAAA